jgi:cyclopropane fatty-acyl-phospholipid synthase-like methyltransferase
MGAYQQEEFYNQIYRERKISSNPALDLLQDYAFKNLSPQDSVLELGCGQGELAYHIIKSDIRYAGFDFSSVAIDKAVGLCLTLLGKAKELVFFKNLDLMNESNWLLLDSKIYGFNTVVAVETFEHLPCDVELLQSLLQRSEKPIKVIATVPSHDYAAHIRYFENKESVQERYAKYFDEFSVEEITIGTDKWFGFVGTKDK